MTNQSSNNPTTVRKIWALLTPPEQRSAVVLLGLMFIGMVLETFGVGLVIPVIVLLTQSDLATRYPALQPALQALGNPSQQALVIGAISGLVGIYLIKNVFLAIYAWWQARFSYDVKAELSQRLLAIYLRQPYAFHLQRNSAQLIRNVVTEVDEFIVTAMLPSASLLAESLVILSLCAMLLVVEPLGTLIVVTVLSVVSWGYHHFTRARLFAWGVARQHHEGLRIQHLHESLGGVKDVKLLGRETDFLEQFRAQCVQLARVGRLHHTMQQLPRLWLELLTVIGIAILVISMLAQDRAPETVLPILGLFAAAAFRLMPSVNRVLSSVQLLRYGLPTIDTLHAELKLAVPQAPDIHTPATPFRDELELKQVTYTYPNAPKPALEDLSLTIRRGELVGFIGASGAGKSTLVDVLLGLLTPESGEVRVDGNSIQNRLRNWQDQIGYVSQSIFLTDDTLRRNVAFGLSNAQIEEAAVWHAIRAAQLEEFVLSLPAGLDTPVGEHGIRLSGGQRQRIGIARALYHDPAILVLDEATSSLDTTTERGVMQAVLALRGSKTILIVAHRLSTVEICNRLYRLERGQIAQEGSYEVVTRTARIQAS